MAERCGKFLQFQGDDGLVTLVRISSIQILAESDHAGDETQLTVASRVFLVRMPLQKLRDLIIDDGLTPVRRSV